jgi:hypothetical protein
MVHLRKISGKGSAGGGWWGGSGGGGGSSGALAQQQLPGWFTEMWLGLPTSISLGIPTDKQHVTLLAHPPEIKDADGKGDDGADQAQGTTGSAAATTTTTDAAAALTPQLLAATHGDLRQSSDGAVLSARTAAADADAPMAPRSGSSQPSDSTAAQPSNSSSSSLTAAPPSAPSAVPAPAPDSPDYIPEFQPLAVLGRGAYSKILLVRDVSASKGRSSSGGVGLSGDHLYAMKVLRKVDVVSVGHEGHVLAEQAILARMSHPFVCRLFYAFQSRSKLYMVMSYAAGGDMWTLLRRQRLSEELCAFYIAELVLALRYTHACGVIHRDVKPVRQTDTRPCSAVTCSTLRHPQGSATHG